MSRYQYSPLRDEATDIRLLTILPNSATSSDEIHILINIIPLEQGSNIEYEALSYTWGSAENLVDIFVGVQEDHVLPVTQNLAEALQHLRDETKEGAFWIDAICIDQQNLQERGRQVCRMAYIYQMATRAIFWLGPGNEQTKIALEIMKHMSSRFEIDWDLAGAITPSREAAESGEEEWADTSISLPWSKEQFDGIFSILNHSWFERVWIRQEVWLTRENATLICGNSGMSWRDFCDVVFFLRQKTVQSR